MQRRKSQSGPREHKYNDRALRRIDCLSTMPERRPCHTIRHDHFLFYFFNHRFYFPALWTSRGYRSLPFSPPVHACLHLFVAQHRFGSASPLLVHFHRSLLTHALALSATIKRHNHTITLPDRRQTSKGRVPYAMTAQPWHCSVADKP